MYRAVCSLSLLAWAALGCNEVTSELDPTSDGRPLELTYLTAAVFAPSCGQAQCHSSFRKAGGLVFDNPEGARHSLHMAGDDNLYLLRFDSERNDGEWAGLNDPDHEYPNLITWVTQIDPFGMGVGRMPYDAPLAKRDIELLVAWIRSSADFEVGGDARGAQCDPDRYRGQSCKGKDLHVCDADGNYGEKIKTCTTCTLVDETRLPSCE